MPVQLYCALRRECLSPHEMPHQVCECLIVLSAADTSNRRQVLCLNAGCYSLQRPPCLQATCGPRAYTLSRVSYPPKAESFEQHVCKDDCMRFAQLPRSRWKEHREEKCGKCGKRRFKEKRASGGSLLLAPAKVTPAQAIASSAGSHMTGLATCL